MEQYIIRGGKPLTGSVNISGAKNAALGMLAASIMTDEEVIIDNLPDVNDVNVLLEAISGLGASVSRKDHTARICGAGIKTTTADHEGVRRMRASYYLLGSLLGKYGSAKVALPGGCAIGARPIDLHLKGFRALGAEVALVENGFVSAKADCLYGAHIYLDKVSVGATINIMMAASLAKGKTIIENAAKEPHIVDVANFLNSMGAHIRGAGTDVIRIEGVEKLHGSEYMVIPDQIEAGTYMFAAAATNGDITVRNVIPKHLEATTAKLLEVGCEIHEFDDAVRVVGMGRLRHTQVTTLPYPGFPTDMQPQMAVLLGLAEGVSTITESIFENRFKYVDELARMGADIKVEGSIAIVSGVDHYMGAEVCAPDLRAGAALMIAGFAAEGVTTIDDIHYIQRGYEQVADKFASLGGDIEFMDTEHDIRTLSKKVS